MKRLFREILSLLKQYILNKNKREYYRLYDKYRNQKRYVLTKNIDLQGYSIDAVDVVSLIFQFKEIFVDQLYLFKANRKKPIIYDCGSNIGLSILFFKSIYKNAKIIAFEADENIAQICKSNIVRNNIDDVQILNKAVWIDNEDISFSIHGADGGSIQGSINTTKVKAIRLKELLESEKYIDLLKIDIEGAEYEVILDCKNSLNNVENIFIEYHSWKNDSQKLSVILNTLENSGFRYYLDTINPKDTPFINTTCDATMDLQVNIFGYRN